MSVKPGLTPKREREIPEYAAMVRRVNMALGRRVGDADVEDLAELLAMRGVVEQATATAIRGMRRRGVSWGDIGRGLGVTRQAAHAAWAWVESLDHGPR
ncbi:MAG: hypothetical protein QM708_07175 [Propioniciclava sp.]|uniref:hypothetical protein n=1 Tax=Propioniciclava sp. TaxID=2038686 RepID=UPI0039E4B6EB